MMKYQEVVGDNAIVSSTVMQYQFLYIAVKVE